MSEIEIRDAQPTRVEIREASATRIEVGLGGPQGEQGIPGVDGTMILTGPAGGVLSGNYPDPDFAEDMATQAELDAAIAAANAFAVAMAAAL